MRELKGRGAAPGCAKGVVARFVISKLSFERRDIKDAKTEKQKLDKARRDYAEYLNEMTADPTQSEDAIMILGAYQEILEDDSFFDTAVKRCERELCNIEYAVKQEQMIIAAEFEQLDNEYLKERAVDIENVCHELIRRIQKKASGKLDGSRRGNEKLIVFAEDLTPEQTLNFDHSIIGGFVTERGGLTSHTVILAKTLGIPAVVGTRAAMEAANDGETVIIYGDTGDVWLDPSDDAIAEFIKNSEQQNRLRKAYAEALGRTAVTLDGEEVDVCINIADWSSEEELSYLETADGVGLYRTEFIYMHSKDYPSEEEQFRYYSTVARLAKGKEVIIRTLDIGGDKQASYMYLPKEENPFLGYRAIRICLHEDEIFQTQLRAILRAGAHGKVSIMFPMISSVEELRAAKGSVEKAKQELRARNEDFDENVSIGIMVETPAAVQLSDSLAKECDFFSIGTNDLIQYTVAVDRMNEKIQYLYTPRSLAVLRSVNMVARNAAKYGTRVNMCGEAASDEALVPLWVAMGLTELSVVPSQVARTKYTVSHINKAEIRKRLDGILALDTVDEVNKKLEEIRERYGL